MVGQVAAIVMLDVYMQEARLIVLDSLLDSRLALDHGHQGSSTTTASWTGLSVGTRYLGAISHSDDVGLLGLTIIAVNP